MVARDKKNGKTIDKDSLIKEARDEIIARACEDLLSMSKQGRQMFTNLTEEEKKTFVGKIKSLINDLMGWIDQVLGLYKSNSTEAQIMRQYKDQLQKASKVWDAMLKESVKVNQALEKSGAYSAFNNIGVDNVVLSEKIVDGKQVVWIEENILKQNKGKPVHQFVADFIAEHIGDVYTIIESGQKIYIGEDLPGEYTQSEYTQEVLQKNPNIVKVKNKAAANIGEIIEIATNRKWEKADHTHNKDAKYGIYKYDTRFGFPVKDAKENVVGANVYKAKLVIRNASDGKKYLYDIVSIKKDKVSSAWLSNKIISPTKQVVGQKNNVSTNSIRNSDKNVKENFFTKDSIGKEISKEKDIRYSEKTVENTIEERQYQVNEIRELFNQWNSDPDIKILGNKVFDKVESVIKEQKKLMVKNTLYPELHIRPYPIRFLNAKEIEKQSLGTLIDVEGAFGIIQDDSLYGITYNIDKMKSSETTDQERARILLHEAIHLCTVNAIDSVERIIPRNVDILSFRAGVGWSVEKKAALELIQIFEQIRASGDGNLYGQKTVYEMVAELSNVEFREFLKKQSLWKRVLNAIKGIFGIESNNALDNTTKALEKILEINTKSTENENTVYSEKNIDNIFLPNIEESEKFKKQVDKWYLGDMNSSEHFEIGKTPIVLKELGANDLPIVMMQDVIVKMTGGKHNISIDEIKNIPEAIADPIMIFKSATVNNAFVILTELTDKSGNDVVVALHLNKKNNRLDVNRIASVYGKEGISKFAIEQFKNGNVLYVDKIKSQKWSTSKGLYLPKLVQSIPDNNIILYKENIVNRYNMQNSNELFSDKDSTIYDEIGETENLRKDYEKLKSDFENFKMLAKLDKKITNGKEFKPDNLLSIAGHKKYYRI